MEDLILNILYFGFSLFIYLAVYIIIAFHFAVLYQVFMLIPTTVYKGIKLCIEEQRR